MFMTLMVVMVSQVYSYPQAHEVGSTEYVRLLTSHTSIKWFLIKLTSFPSRSLSAKLM